MTLSIPIEYLSSVCEVKTIENELVLTGVISEITPEYVEISDKSERVEIMPTAGYGTEVKINVFNSRQGFRVLAGKVYTCGINFIRIVEVSSILDYERRHFFRVETKVHAQLQYMDEEREEREVQVLVRNLSLGGVLFESELMFEKGQMLRLRMKLGRVLCEFPCRIQRAEDYVKDKWLYGCEFGESSQTQNNALCAYIFQRQRERIHRQAPDGPQS